MRNVAFLIKKIEAAGFQVDNETQAKDIPTDVWTKIRLDCFHECRDNRKLRRLFDQRKRLEETKDKNGVGLREAKATGKHGAKSFQPHKKTKRFGRVRQSAMHMIFLRVKEAFERQRRAGNHVDRQDLYIEWLHEGNKLDEEVSQDPKPQMEKRRAALAFKARLKAIERKPKNKEKTINYIRVLCKANLLKPQRLISLSPAEEKARYCLTMKCYDRQLYLVALAPLEILKVEGGVSNPEAIRKNVKKLAVRHSDQIPTNAKIKPDLQLYAEWESTSTKKDREANRAYFERLNKKNLTQKSLLPDEGDLSIVSQAEQQSETNVSTMKRGEATENQDKFRVTVDAEQVFYNICNPAEPVRADFGFTSVTFPGAYCDVSNISAENTWIKTQAVIIDGKSKVYEAGKPIPAQMAQGLLRIRDEQPELWQKAHELGFRFYQQPAGFEDSWITMRKIEKQQDQTPCCLTVRDLFGGGTSEDVKLFQATLGQLRTFILGKMGCVAQITDTDVAFRLKAKLQTEMDNLRLELKKLAEAEGVRAIFRCGFYEVVRSLVNAVDKLRQEMLQNDDLVKAARRNGWLAYQVDVDAGKLVGIDQQPWCDTQIFPEGNHRMQPSWISERYDWLDEDGYPSAIPEEEYDKILSTQTDQTYLCDETAIRELSIWRELLDDEKLTRAQVDQMKKEPHFSFMVHEFSGFESAAAEYKELVKTPQQLRKEYGIDVHLTSQKPKDVSATNLAKHKKFREAMRPLRQGMSEFMEEFRKAGVSRKTLAALIIPSVGKKTSKEPNTKAQIKDRLRATFAKWKKNQKMSATQAETMKKLEEILGEGDKPKDVEVLKKALEDKKGAEAGEAGEEADAAVPEVNPVF